MLAEAGDPELTRVFQDMLASAFAGAERRSHRLAAAHHHSIGASSLAAAAEPPIDFTEVLSCQGRRSPLWLSAHLLFL